MTTSDATGASAQAVSPQGSPSVPEVASPDVAFAPEPSPASPSLQQAALVPSTLKADVVTAPLTEVAEPLALAEAVPDLVARPLPVGWAKWADDDKVLLSDEESEFGHCYDGEPVFTHNANNYIALMRPVRDACVRAESGGLKDRALRVIGQDGEICTVKVTDLFVRSEYIDRGGPDTDEVDRYNHPPLIAWGNGGVRLWGLLTPAPGDCSSPSVRQDSMNSTRILTLAERAAPPFAAQAKGSRALQALAQRAFKTTRRNVDLQASYEGLIQDAKSRIGDANEDDDDGRYDEDGYDEDRYDITARNERLLSHAAKVKRWDHDMTTTYFVDRTHGREFVTVEAFNYHFCEGDIPFSLATTFEVTRDRRGKAKLSEVAQSNETPIALVDLDADGNYELLLRGGGPCENLRVETARQDGPGEIVMYKHNVPDRSWNEGAADERYEAYTERFCRCRRL